MDSFIIHLYIKLMILLLLLAQFLADNCSVILFHYDGNVDGWHDLEWANKTIHILAQSQTKW